MNLSLKPRSSKQGWVILVLAMLGLIRAGRAEPTPDATVPFYDPESVQTIHLRIKAEDLNRLNRALPQRIYVPGSFSWNGRELENVGIRYKGDSSSNPDATHKRAFLIAFSEFKPGQRFLGLRHVALDNGIQFGSLFSERLITDVLRGAGITASRCNFARVFLNGTNAGVYVNVERIDKSFLSRNFQSDSGILLKVDHGGPGADLRDEGLEQTAYEKTFEVHSGKKRDAFANLQLFIRAVNNPQVDEAELRGIFDVDAFLKTTAVMLLAGAFDQYTGWGPHNYYLYQDPVIHRWTYIPWDLDVGFADHAFGRVPVLAGWHAAWPVPIPGRPLLERLVSHPNLLEEYRKQARVILEASFKPELLTPKLRGLYQQIEADLANDPFPPRRVTVATDKGYNDILASIEDFIQKRYALAKVQLENPGKRPQYQSEAPPNTHEEPRPGSASADAPSDLRAVKVTASKVDLQWNDHGEGEVAYIVQRCSGADCLDFVNCIGQPGPNITNATDLQVRAGQTYRYRVYAVLPTPHGPRGTGVSNPITVHIPER